MTDDRPASLQSQSVDYVVLAAKAVLGAVPFAGSLLAELAGTIIPNQRIDRLAKFAAELEARIATLDQHAMRRAAAMSCTVLSISRRRAVSTGWSSVRRGANAACAPAEAKVRTAAGHASR